MPNYVERFWVINADQSWGMLIEAEQYKAVLSNVSSAELCLSMLLEVMCQLLPAAKKLIFKKANF